MSRRILIVGLGASGLAAARLARERGLEAVLYDAGQPSVPADLSSCEKHLGRFDPALLLDIDLVVTSPGVPTGSQPLRAAKALGIPVRAEVDFAFAHRPELPLAAITGSNGKSTVTALTGAMLEAAGLRVGIGGNLGPAASELAQAGDHQAWVLEISSFQAELLQGLRARAATILNITQDHLERHGSMAAYARAKGRLLELQEPGDLAVLPADDAELLALPGQARRQTFSVNGRADAWLDGHALRLGDELLAETAELRLVGRHNLANALAAALLARELGADRKAIRTALLDFDGLPHRHRLVAEIAGVRWVDDSKATNVGATAAALEGAKARTVHLILGGVGKGQDFSGLRPLVESACHAVYLIGEASDEIAATLDRSTQIHLCGELANAVTQARDHAGMGDTVLLAPACASFDQFRSYIDRGEAFARLVKGQLEEVPCR